MRAFLAGLPLNRRMLGDAEDHREGQHDQSHPAQRRRPAVEAARALQNIVQPAPNRVMAATAIAVGGAGLKKPNTR